jgi:hypothetical protein
MKKKGELSSKYRNVCKVLDPNTAMHTAKINVLFSMFHCKETQDCIDRQQTAKEYNVFSLHNFHKHI